MRLQITGGEPLIDAYFAETYQEVYDRGIVTTVSTNGSWLARDKISQLFRDRPPLRVTVSMYGAQAASYEAMTHTPKGTFERFLKGLDSLSRLGINLRLNIIASTFNQHEIAKMRQLASHFTDDYHVFDHMSATIHGGNEPLIFQVDDLFRAKLLDHKPSFNGCGAGVESLHVDPSGLASMCKVGRETQVDLVNEPIEAIERLSHAAREQLSRSGDCGGCAIQESCVTCPVIVSKYRSANTPTRMYCRQS